MKSIFYRLILVPLLLFAGYPALFAAPDKADANAPANQTASDAVAAQAPASDAVAPKGSVIFSDNIFLQQLQERDSVLIGDQLIYGVKMDKVSEGTSFIFPEYKDSLCTGVLALTPWTIDTLKTHKAGKGAVKKYDIAAGIVITSFDEGEYRLPDIVVLRNSPEQVVDTLLYKGLVLPVMTMPVDTANFVVHDIKGQIRYPVTFSDVLPWLILVLGLAAIAVGIVFLVKYISRRKGLGPEHKDPAHIVALRKLDKYRGDKFWAPEKQKTFYSGVTDVLREYIASRYEIGAMEMTTAEIFTELKPLFKDDVEAHRQLVERLQELFETADFVKFAKHISEESETAAVLPLAVKFVTETYQAEIQSESEETTSQNN